MGKQNAYVEAMRRVDGAASLSRQRDTASSLPAGYARYRYEQLRRNPQMLEAFVSSALGTRDPARVLGGAQKYLKEMERRYGTE